MSQPVGPTPTLTTLAEFDAATGGQQPYDLLIDNAGNLIGVSNFGNASTDNPVFELAKDGSTYAATLTTIAYLTGLPVGTVNSISGSSSLFGTAMMGGTAGSGAVFEIENSSGTYASTPITLASFNGTNGMYPGGMLITDNAGDLFGTTEFGGTSNDGTVFELVKTPGGYADTPIVIANFNGTDGSVPQGGLYMDSAGNLFGTTQNGGTDGYGEIYEIANTGTAYGTISVLASVSPVLGPYLTGNLTADANGDLFGTSSYGGANGEGAIFELVKTADGYASTLSVLTSFDGTDGRIPNGALLLDANGNLFGVTQAGGSNDDGTVFELAKSAGTYASTVTTIAEFNGTNGYLPEEIVTDSSGNLFGITFEGGTLNEGTVFEVTNSGYAVNPVCFVEGTKLATPHGDVAVERLRPGDIVTTPVGPAPVRWVGRRAYDGRFINGNHMALPVTIKAGALSDGLPARDLHVSPGHGIWLSGTLIPAWRLINGISITQPAAVHAVTYYHVELAGHALLFAEGALTESFLDDGTFRNRFQNVAEYWALYPDAPACRETTALPRLESGFHLAAIQAQVNQRAGIAVDGGTGPLRGYIDTDGTGNYVHGWAQDMAHPETAVILRLSAGGRDLGRVIANNYRADLRQAGIGSGCHGFSWEIPCGYSGTIEIWRESDGSLLPRSTPALRKASL